MKKIFTLCFLMALVCVKGWGQTIISPTGDGGFETGTTFAANGWTEAQQNGSINNWYVGTIAKTDGSRGAYIGAANATTNTYDMGTTRQAQYIYRSVSIPAGATNISLSFKWRCVGETGSGANQYDFMRVYLAPGGTAPAAGTLLDPSYIAGTVTKYYSSSATTFSTATISLDAATYANTTKVLAFCWRNDGSGGANPPAAIDEISLTYVLPTCIAPTGLTASSITASSANLSWTASSSSPASYDIYYNTTGTAPTAATAATTTSTTTSKSLTGLSAQTPYYAWVRSACSASDKSAWTSVVSFTTPCASSSLPFTETFTSTTFPPTSCWAISNSTYIIRSAANGYGASGTGSAEFYFYNASAGNYDLTLPPITATPANYQLSFDEAYATYSGEVDNLVIRYSTNGGTTYNDLATYTGGASGTLNTGGTVGSSQFVPSATQWKTQTVTLPTGTTNVVFRGASANGNNLYVDNISIAAPPSCIAPTNVTAIATSSTTATVSWTASASLPSSYDIYGNTTGTAPTASTAATFTSSTTSKSITGLNPSTIYYIWVRSVCSASDKSTWVAAGSLTTPPVNDNCTSAISLTIGASVIQGNLTGATATPDANNPNTNTYPDVYYTFTPTVSGTYTITINNFSVSGDRDIYVYSSCPSVYTGATGAIATGATGSTSDETATGTTFVAGTSYKILVQDYAKLGGTFDIQVIAVPVITVTPTSLTGFSQTVGTPSAPQSYTVSATNVSSNVAVTAPANYQVALSSNGTYGASLSLPVSGGVITGQPVTIYVRLNASAAGTYNGNNVTNSSTGATTANVAVSGSAQIACTTPLSPVAPLTLTSSGTTVTGTFSAPSSAPSNYLVIRTTSSTPPSTPVNTVSYPNGSIALGGTIVANPTTTSFTDNAAASTTYYYWVYSYNNSSCSGGPLYSTEYISDYIATACAVNTLSLSGNTSVNWSTASWSLGHVPLACEDVVIQWSNTSANSYTSPAVVINQAVNINSLTITATSTRSAYQYFFEVRQTSNFPVVIANGLTVSATGGFMNSANPNQDSYAGFFSDGSVTVGSKTTVGATGTNLAYIGSNSATPVYNFNGDVAIGAFGTTSSNGTYNFKASGAQTLSFTIPSTTFYPVFNNLAIGDGVNPTALTISGASTKGGYTNGSLTVNSGSSLIIPSGNSLNQNVANAGTFTLANSASLQVGGTTSASNASNGVTGSNFPGGFLTYTFDPGSSVIYNAVGAQTVYNTSVYGNLTLSNTGTATAGGALTVKGNLTVNNGSTLDVSSSNFGVSIAGNWVNSGAFTPKLGTVTFNGTIAQTITGATTFYNLITNNTSGGITLASSQIVSNTLTLTNGIVTTSATNLLSVTGTATGAVSGGSTASFVNGPLRRTLPALTASPTVYNYPVGAGTTYLPASFTSLTSSAGSTLQVQGVNGDVTAAGATGDGTTLGTGNSALSTTEYWTSAITGTISNASLSVTRQTPVSPISVIGKSVTTGGVYSSIGGTPSGNSVNNSSAFAPGATQFYCIAQKPGITIRSVLTPGSINSCFGTASANMTFSVSGSGLIDGITVTAPTGFEVSLSTGSGFAGSITIGSGNSVPSTPVYVRLKASDAVGSYSGNINLTSNSAATQTVAISSSTVNSLPTPALTATVNGTTITAACKGVSVTYTTDNPELSYVWTFSGTSGVDYTIVSGGNSTSSTAVVQWLTTGTKTVTVNYSNSNSCMAATPTSLSVTVNSLPVPTFTTAPAPGSQLCGNTDVTYTTEAGQGTYTWTASGNSGQDYSVTGGSFSTNTVTLRWLTAGSKTVTVNYSNGSNCAGATPASNTIIILDFPTAYNVGGGGGYCSLDGGQTGNGVTISLGGSQPVGTYTYTYELYNTNVATGIKKTGTGSGLNFTGILAGGTYTILATNTTTGCTNFMTGSATVTVNSYPNDYYVISGSGTTCGTGTIGLDGSDGNTVNYILQIRVGTQPPYTYSQVSTQPGTGSALSFTVTQSGTYRITADNGSCQTNSFGQVAVIVNPRPIPTFTAPPSSPLCQNSSVTYTTQSGQSSYVWTVPGISGTDYTITAGGTSSTNNTVTLTWLTAGSKTVTVNYNNSFGCNGVNPATSTIIINPLPIATIGGTTTVCQNTGLQTITFTGANGIAPYTFTYTISGVSGNKTISTTSGNSVTVSQPTTTAGTYTYTLVSVQESSTTTCSNTASGSATVTVNPLPTATISASGTPVCQNGTSPVITFTGANGSLLPYTFTYTISGDASQHTIQSNGSGIATIEVPTTTANITYTYTLVSVKDANTTACSSSYNTNNTATATISPNAVAGTITGTTPLCIGSTATYTSNGDIGGTWTSTNTAVATVNSSGVVTATGAGTTTITYTVTGCNAPAPATKALTVSQNATAGTVSGSTPLCIGSTATYTSNGDANGTWSSTNTAVATVNASTGVVTATGAGTTNITYTVSTGCNNPVSAFKTLTVSPNATAGIVSGSTPLCTGSTATYTSNGDANGTWSSTNTAVATVTASTGVVTATGAGTTNITYTVSTGCNNPVSAFKTLTVNQTPVASIITQPYTACDGSAPGVTFSGTANAIISYTITIQGGGSIATTPVQINSIGDNQTIAAQSGAGTYIYTITGVTTGNGCTGTITNATTTVTIDPASSIVLSSGSSADQAVCKGGNFSNIVYNVTASGNVTPTIIGLPAGLTGTYSAAAGTFIIGGTLSPTVTGVYPYTINVPGGTCGTAVSASGTITVSVSWIGGTLANATNWNTPTNWCNNSVPTTADYVTIPAGTPLPVLNDNAAANNLEIQSGEAVSLNGHTLTIAGAISGSGTITGSATSGLTTTGAAGTVSFTAGAGILHKLTVNGGSLTLGNALTIDAGTYTDPGMVTATGTLNAGNNLTLKSTALGDAIVGQSAGAISGNVTVERYITVRRAWRFLSVPVTTTQSINDAWQEGAVNTDLIYGNNVNPHPGFGTHITYNSTSVTAPTTGFDVNTTANPGLKYWDAANNVWLPVTSTKQPLNTYAAYCLFIRGSRAVDLSKGAAATKDATVLRTIGSLNVGANSTSYTGVTAGNQVLVNNPYASPVDILTVLGHNASNFATNKFYVWDPTLAGSNGVGGYLTYANNEWTPRAPASGTTVQSGEAFMLEATGAGTNLSFVEGDKSTLEASASRVVQQEESYPVIHTSLLFKDGNQLSLLDGVAAGFDNKFSGKVDVDDASKLWNTGENIALTRDSQQLAIEFRPMPNGTDTLFYKLYLKQQPYTLQLFSENLKDNFSAKGWLIDKYLNTQTEVNLYDTTLYSFTPNTDTNSYRNRFMLVFQNNAVVLPVTITKVSASAQNGGVAVSWTVANEVNIKGYTVEKSTDGRTFTTAGTQQPAKNNPQAALTSYSGYDATPVLGNNYYRIRIEGKDGVIHYSQIVNVTITGGAGSGIQITLYPNPVRDGMANLVLTNLAEGSYLVSVYSGSGQTVYQKKVTITLAGTTQSEQLLLGKTLAQGSYQIKVADHKGNNVFTDKLIVGR